MATVYVPTASTLAVPFLDVPGFWEVFGFEKAMQRVASTDPEVWNLPASRLIAQEILDFCSDGVSQRVPSTTRQAITALYEAYRPRATRIPGFFAQLRSPVREDESDCALADQLVSYIKCPWRTLRSS